MFEIHKRKLLRFTILVFWNFHFNYWTSLQTQKIVQNFSKAVSGKHSKFHKVHKVYNLTMDKTDTHGSDFPQG